MWIAHLLFGRTAGQSLQVAQLHADHLVEQVLRQQTRHVVDASQPAHRGSMVAAAKLVSCMCARSKLPH